MGSGKDMKGIRRLLPAAAAPVIAAAPVPRTPAKAGGGASSDDGARPSRRGDAERVGWGRAGRATPSGRQSRHRQAQREEEVDAVFEAIQISPGELLDALQPVPKRVDMQVHFVRAALPRSRAA
jgi:hypothetical protein